MGGLQVLTTLVKALPLQDIYNSQKGNNNYIHYSVQYFRVQLNK